MRSGLQRNFSSPGFTLLEILLVTIILAILVSIATPKFRNSFDALQFRNAVQDIAELSRYGHERAILERTTIRLQFLSDPPRLRLEKLVEGRDGNPNNQALSIAGPSRHLPPGVEADCDPPQILFYPDGSATPRKWHFKDRNGNLSSVEVAGESGEVAVSESQ